MNQVIGIKKYQEYAYSHIDTSINKTSSAVDLRVYEQLNNDAALLCLY